ncbi:SPFH domain-containing protein [Nocardioides sp.]|uniref:SPFH domain-containing protein n=1 Tax=Nocardioides sp. TaxID=35761 RepID=UPI0025FEBA05|nr:SPFH domain-containing protein [Nocardioides sp.]
MTDTVLLLAAAGVLVGCWAATCVRRVPAGQWLAVVRGGVVRRSHVAGFAWRLPLVERFARDLSQPHDLPVMVRATTSDGVPVVVLLEASVSIPAPPPGTRYADPWPAAEVAAEETVARVVTEWSAAGLTQTASAARLPLRRAVRATVDELGVEVHDLELVEVGVQLPDGGRGPS